MPTAPYSIVLIPSSVWSVLISLISTQVAFHWILLLVICYSVLVLWSTFDTDLSFICIFISFHCLFVNSVIGRWVTFRLFPILESYYWNADLIESLRLILVIATTLFVDSLGFLIDMISPCRHIFFVFLGSSLSIKCFLVQETWSSFAALSWLLQSQYYCVSSCYRGNVWMTQQSCCYY